MPELITNSWWMFIVLGILSGILSGCLGVGSGALLIPALVIIFTIPQKSAQGMALAVMVPMALVGAIRYKLNPNINIDYNHVILISIGALVGVMIGTELITKIPAHALKKIFAIFLIIVAVKMLFTQSKNPIIKKQDIKEELK